MNPNPLSDTIGFLLKPGWTSGILWLLLLGSVVIAVYVYRTFPGQRRIEQPSKAASSTSPTGFVVC
jgi:hypothetical protein